MQLIGLTTEDLRPAAVHDDRVLDDWSDVDQVALADQMIEAMAADLEPDAAVELRADYRRALGATSSAR